MLNFRLYIVGLLICYSLSALAESQFKSDYPPEGHVDRIISKYGLVDSQLDCSGTPNTIELTVNSVASRLMCSEEGLSDIDEEFLKSEYLRGSLIAGHLLVLENSSVGEVADGQLLSSNHANYDLKVELAYRFFRRLVDSVNTFDCQDSRMSRAIFDAYYWARRAELASSATNRPFVLLNNIYHLLRESGCGSFDSVLIPEIRVGIDYNYIEGVDYSDQLRDYVHESYNGNRRITAFVLERIWANGTGTDWDTLVEQNIVLDDKYWNFTEDQRTRLNIASIRCDELPLPLCIDYLGRIEPL